MEKSIRKKVVAITGASSGVGESIAILLASLEPLNQDNHSLSSFNAYVPCLFDIFQSYIDGFNF